MCPNLGRDLILKGHLESVGPGIEQFITSLVRHLLPLPAEKARRLKRRRIIRANEIQIIRSNGIHEERLRTVIESENERKKNRSNYHPSNLQPPTANQK